MSVVTDVILLVSLTEEGPEDVFPPVDEVNNWLRENGQNAGLNHLNGHEGGHKAWQADVFGAAFNFLDIEGFVQTVAGAKWIAPDRVQLLIKGEEDEVWGLVNIVVPQTNHDNRAVKQSLQEGHSEERSQTNRGNETHI